MKENRLDKFMDDLRTEMSDSEIAAALQNGDIRKPNWLGMSDSVDHTIVRDTYGDIYEFYRLWY